MNSKFKFSNRYKFPEIEADTDSTGYRVYHTPEGTSPSVTTILSTLPKPQLDAWKKRVGYEEAARISKESTTIGSYMHGSLENYFNGIEDKPPVDDLQAVAYKMSRAMKLYSFRGLDEIWGIEEALYCSYLYAGRSDLIGVYDGKPSIVDFKTSKKLKKDEYIYDYKLQCGAYAIAFEMMFGVSIDQAVILIAIRPTKWQPSDVQKFIISGDEFKQAKTAWMNVVSDFYTE
jgi:CRISPR/Cas system-associated exonuclease Cas4 (RecB family)